jgi:N-acylneuraminate cytidylyltransferase
MKTLAIIPARGGSKRIPKKNIKDFSGKSIIAYSIEAALSSKLFDEVMVSTDDTAIAEIATEFGAKVPFIRSEKQSDDFATLMDVISEVINTYKSQGQAFEYVCCLLPTAPFVTANKIQNAFDVLKAKNFDTVFPVLEFSYPIQRALKIKEDQVAMVDDQYATTRSQDLEQRYHDSGQFYWAKVDTIMQQQTLFTDNSGAIVISELEAQDIDTETDWKLAEMKYKMMMTNEDNNL